MLKKVNKPKVQQPQPTEDFYKNIEAIIKEAENLGLEKIVLQKNPGNTQMTPDQPHVELRKMPTPSPVTEVNSNLEYSYCDVSTDMNHVIKSPIFFMENDKEVGESKFINLPTPATVTRQYLQDYVDIGKAFQGDKFRSPNRLFNNILIDEFIKVIETNIYAVFYNGLYEFLKPFLNITQDQVASIFQFDEESNRRLRYRISSAVLSNRKNDSMESVYGICVDMATIVGNLYFDFVNSIMIHGFANLKELTTFLAETQGIPIEKISSKQYYMFTEGCLLELAAEDVHKVIEIVEANAIRSKIQYELEDYSGDFDYDEDDE